MSNTPKSSVNEQLPIVLSDILINPDYQYNDEDIKLYHNAVIKDSLGGYEGSFLLKEKFHPYNWIAVTPPVSTVGKNSTSISYFLDKDEQPGNKLADNLTIVLERLTSINKDVVLLKQDLVNLFDSSLNETSINTILEEIVECNFERQLLEEKIQLLRTIEQEDVFDELMPKLQNEETASAKILLPYNIIERYHWVIAEIVINKEGNNYRIDIYTHDPMGVAKMDNNQFLILKEAIVKRIKAQDKDANSLNVTNHNSPYTTSRQYDVRSCGIISAEELIDRIKGQDLTTFYQHGAYNLHSKQIKIIADSSSIDPISKKNYLQRNTHHDLYKNSQLLVIKQVIQLLNLIKEERIKLALINAFADNSLQKESDTYFANLRMAFKQQLEMAQQSDTSMLHKLASLIFKDFHETSKIDDLDLLLDYEEFKEIAIQLAVAMKTVMVSVKPQLKTDLPLEPQSTGEISVNVIPSPQADPSMLIATKFITTEVLNPRLNESPEETHYLLKHFKELLSIIHSSQIIKLVKDKKYYYLSSSVVNAASYLIINGEPETSAWLAAVATVVGASGYSFFKTLEVANNNKDDIAEIVKLSSILYNNRQHRKYLLETYLPVAANLCAQGFIAAVYFWGIAWFIKDEDPTKSAGIRLIAIYLITFPLLHMLFNALNAQLRSSAKREHEALQFDVAFTLGEHFANALKQYAQRHKRVITNMLAQNNELSLLLCKKQGLTLEQALFILHLVLHLKIFSPTDIETIRTEQLNILLQYQGTIYQWLKAHKLSAASFKQFPAQVLNLLNRYGEQIEQKLGIVFASNHFKMLADYFLKNETAMLTDSELCAIILGLVNDFTPAETQLARTWSTTVNIWLEHLYWPQQIRQGLNSLQALNYNTEQIQAIAGDCYLLLDYLSRNIEVARELSSEKLLHLQRNSNCRFLLEKGDIIIQDLQAYGVDSLADINAIDTMIIKKFVEQKHYNLEDLLTFIRQNFESIADFNVAYSFIKDNDMIFHGGGNEDINVLLDALEHQQNPNDMFNNNNINNSK